MSEERREKSGKTETNERRNTSEKRSVWGRIEQNRGVQTPIEKHEIWIGPWWYSHSICLSVGLYWYSGESSSSSSTYQKAVLWSINMPWESKLFFFDGIGHLPRNCLEVWASFEGSLLWVTGYIYKRAENQIFNLLWVSWAADPLVAVSTAENEMLECLVSA